MDTERFDQIVKGLLSGRASRRLFARGLVAVSAAGVPLAGAGLDAVARRRRKRSKGRKGRKGHKPLRCSGDSCDGTGGKECGGRDDCQCYRWAKGGNVCASSLQSSCEVTCDHDHDCPHGHVCVLGGPACCGEGEKFCKKACHK